MPQPKNSLITMKVMAATTTQNMGQASGALPAMCWLMNWPTMTGIRIAPIPPAVSPRTGIAQRCQGYLCPGGVTRRARRFLRASSSALRCSLAVTSCADFFCVVLLCRASSCAASSRAAFSCALSALYSVIQCLSFLLPYSFINVARNTICTIDGRVVIYATYFGVCISRSTCTDINRRILHLRGNPCGMEAYVFDLLSTRFLHHCTFSALFYTTRIWGIPALARHRASRTPYIRPAKELRTTLQRCSEHPANTP